ncbi:MULTISPECIES: hypothetical protein [unclassified Romboutsia]|uniref:hypothetical protein n=1 Tax=unclassified Romboutsia TaxID=2626894 RepID=UPI002ED4764B
MKIGIRKPSVKKSISSRTTGRVTRSVKKITSPGYGKKGMGMIKKPSKSLYNKVYRKTTTSITSVGTSYKGSKSTTGSSYKINSSSYKSKGSSYKVKSSSYKSKSYRPINYNGYSIGVNDYEDLYEENKLENKTKYYEIEYTAVKREGYNPTELKEDRFSEKKIRSNEEEVYVNDLDYLITIDELPILTKANHTEYSMYDVEFTTENIEGYVMYDNLEGFSHCIHYNNRYDSKHNISSLYSNMNFNTEVKAKLQMNKVKDRIFINAIYENKGKVEVGEICYIQAPKINEELQLCSNIKIEATGLFLDKLKFKIYIAEDDFNKILVLRDENQTKRLIKEEKYRQLTENQDVSYQFSILGVEAENDGYLEDAILNYEKSIELGYSTAFTYERLYLIYRYMNDMDNAIRVIEKGIEDLSVINEIETLTFIDDKIDAFKTVLNSTDIISLEKECIEEYVEEDNKSIENKPFFSKLLSKFKKDIIPNAYENLENTIDEIKAKYEDVEEGIIEYNKLLTPLKMSRDRFKDREFYNFEPKGYIYYDKLEGFSHCIHFYKSYSDRYNHFNENRYDVKFLNSFELMLTFEKHINIDFILENRDEKIFIVALFEKDKDVVKCEIGYIYSPKINPDLEMCTDIKVQIRKLSYGSINLNIYIKEDEFNKINDNIEKKEEE